MKIVLYTEGLAFAGDTDRRQALGGSESAFIAVARAFAAGGHEVHAHCLCPAPGVYDGVHYHEAAEALRWEGEACDLFICSRFFHVFSRELRAERRLLWMHDILPESWARPLRAVLGRIDSIYCLSRFHAAQVGAVLPEARQKLRVIANGVDLGRIAAATKDVVKQRRILFTSRAERGLEAALDAYTALDDRSLAFGYCSYRPLPDASVETLEARCAQRMAALRAQGFDVAAASLDKDALYRTLAGSLAVIYPASFAEIFCISALEAQACGVVFLTVDDFALPETMGYPGVPPNDPTAFLSRLRSIIADPSERGRLEETGRRHAAAFDWNRVAAQFLISEPRPSEPPQILSRRGRGVAAELKAALARVSSPRTLSPPVRSASVPMISCLSVTYDRLTLLKRAIRSYCDQTYPNRELLIVTDGEARFRAALEDHLLTLGRDDIRIVGVNGGRRALGALRNISLAEARGAIVCQWDDDDCSHPRRLETQAAHMAASKADACFLTEHLHFFARERRLLWTDWTYGGQTWGKWRLAPGTLMMRRDLGVAYPESGEAAVRGEDSALVDSIYGRLRIAPLSGCGHLYLYTYHGRNTFAEAHHLNLANAAAPPAFLDSHATALAEALAYYPLPRPLVVMAGGGSIYRIEG